MRGKNREYYQRNQKKSGYSYIHIFSINNASVSGFFFLLFIYLFFWNFRWNFLGPWCFPCCHKCCRTTEVKRSEVQWSEVWRSSSFLLQTIPNIKR